MLNGHGEQISGRSLKKLKFIHTSDLFYFVLRPDGVDGACASLVWQVAVPPATTFEKVC